MKSTKHFFHRISSLTLAVLLVTLLVACGSRGSSTLVPNVMGLNYLDAVAALESMGFEVTAVEADASTIIPTAPSSSRRTVLQGQVFRVNDTFDPTYSDRLNSSGVVILLLTEKYS